MQKAPLFILLDSKFSNCAHTGVFGLRVNYITVFVVWCVVHFLSIFPKSFGFSQKPIVSFQFQSILITKLVQLVKSNHKVATSVLHNNSSLHRQSFIPQIICNFATLVLYTNNRLQHQSFLPTSFATLVLLYTYLIMFLYTFLDTFCHTFYMRFYIRFLHSLIHVFTRVSTHVFTHVFVHVLYTFFQKFLLDFFSKKLFFEFSFSNCLNFFFLNNFF